MSISINLIHHCNSLSASKPARLNFTVPTSYVPNFSELSYLIKLGTLNRGNIWG